MNIRETQLPGVLIIEQKIFHDPRGYFLETYREDRYPARFVQHNFSYSQKNVVRGLHYQLVHPQGKLVFVTRGRVLDVIVDIRLGSPTFGRSIAIELNEQQAAQSYIPPGLAHGFCVLSESADFFYQCTDYYYPAGERGVRWNDPDLNIAWPVETPLVAERDAAYPCLKDIPREDLPLFDREEAHQDELPVFV